MNSDVAKLFYLLRRRWLVAVSFCILGLGLLPLAALVVPAYKGTAELLIVSEALTKDTTASDPDLPSIVRSTEVLSKVIDRLKLHTDPLALSKKIKTKLPARSSILEITYKDTNRQNAVDVANAVADESVSYFHDIATRGYTDVILAIDKRIAESKLAIAAADKRLQHASANSGFESSDKALDDLTSQIDDLEVQRGQISSSLAADQATASGLQEQLHDIAPIVRGEILQKDVVYQTVQTVVGKDTADLLSQRASFRNSFPGLRALGQRVDIEWLQSKSVANTAVANGAGESPSYTQTILDSERANSTVNADRERLRATDAQLSEERDHLRRVAGAGAVVGTLRAERDAALQQYISLTQRLSTAQGDAAQAASLGSLVVVSRAIPGQSDLGIYMFALGLLVLALAIGLAYVVDVADRRFWGDREIERVYGRPVLAKVGSAAGVS